MTSKLTFSKIKKNKGMQQDIKQHQTFLQTKAAFKQASA